MLLPCSETRRRRSWPPLLLLQAAGLLAACVGAPRPLSAADPRAATIFRVDTSRSGHAGGPAPRHLRALWRYVRDEHEMVLSSPAVVGGRVYAATCYIDVFGNYGAIVCLDAATGKQVWATDAIGKEEMKGFFSSPALTADGKYLVIGQGLHYDKDCSLICLHATTGKLHWRVKTPLHVEGSPAIRGDLAVAGAGAVEGRDMRPRGNPGFVFAVRISDGKELWRHALADPESSPAIADDGTVYIGSGFNGCAVVALRSESDGELRARGLARLLWRSTTPYPATGAVTLAGDLAIVGCGKGGYVGPNPDPAGAVVAFDRRTGKLRWTRKMADAVLGAVAAGDNVLLCPVRNGHVLALRLGDGRPVWREPSAISGGAPVLAGPAVAGRYVYAVSSDGYLAILEAATGKLVEKHYINERGKPGEMGLSVSSPVVAAGRVFVGSETGGLRCFIGRELK